jgi:glycine cleavage system regulatory protein
MVGLTPFSAPRRLGGLFHLPEFRFDRVRLSLAESAGPFYNVPMQSTLVMTVIGTDRPGLVELVAATIAGEGGNWLESRMCRLDGEFAGILRIGVPAGKQAALLQALKNIEAQGLNVTVKSGGTGGAGAHHRFASLEIIGQDRPGIVREISSALARQGMNVEELNTECHSAPMSGETLFRASAKLMIPESCDVAALRGELERIAGNLLVDVSFEEL